jgi:hypothetical protein
MRDIFQRTLDTVHKKLHTRLVRCHRRGSIVQNKTSVEEMVFISNTLNFITENLTNKRFEDYDV